jgi:bifunctional DNA-binding transcriptional regulator/antitoxin component of YhaV-PrlF toxin-antitoxin module
MSNEKSQRCHVFPRGRNWVVRVDKLEENDSVHESRREAIEAAKGLAHRHICEVVIHSSDPKDHKRKTGEPPSAVRDEPQSEDASDTPEAQPEATSMVTVSEKLEVVIPEEFLSPLSLYPGARLQVVRFEDRLELVPEKRIKEMRGFLKGMDTAVPRGGHRQ